MTELERLRGDNAALRSVVESIAAWLNGPRHGDAARAGLAHWVQQEIYDVLASGAGEAEAEVIAAAVLGRQTCRTTFDETEEEPACGMCLWEETCKDVERMQKGPGDA